MILVIIQIVLCRNMPVDMAKITAGIDDVTDELLQLLDICAREVSGIALVR